MQSAVPGCKRESARGKVRGMLHLLPLSFLIVLLAPLLPAQGSAGAPPEPDWKQLETQLRDPRAGVRWRALHRCLRHRAAALPLLLRLLEQSKDPGVLRVVQAGICELGRDAREGIEGVQKVLLQGSPAQAAAALEVIRVVGPFAEDGALAELKNAVFRLKQQRQGREVPRDLISTSSRVPSLVALTTGPLESAAAVLAEVQSDSALRQLHGLEQARRLGELSPDLRARAAHLLRAEVDPKVRFRVSAQHAGGSWGWSGSVTMRGIGTRVRLAAARLLETRKAWPEDLPRLDRVLPFLGSPDPARRRQAILELGGLARRADRELVDELRPLLADPEPTVVWEAITVLGMLGAKAESALGRLDQLAKSPDRNLQVRARAAAAQIRTDLNKEPRK